MIDYIILCVDVFSFCHIILYHTMLCFVRLGTTTRVIVLCCIVFVSIIYLVIVVYITVCIRYYMLDIIMYALL
jgi:hypothetical protein